MRTFFYKSHRWLARILALPVILWALSGILHPFMANWSKPEIAHRFLPPQAIPSAAIHVELSTVLAQQGIEQIDNFHLKRIGQQWHYQLVQPDGSNLYYSTADGSAAPDAELALVQELALAYTDYTADQIEDIERVTEFNLNYRFIKRLLPVYRVRFDTPSAFEVYIDPATGKLASYSNSTTRWQRIAFAIGHTWAFLGNESSLLRVCLISIFIALATWVGISGIIIWAKFPSTFTDGRKRKLRTDRKLHRWFGIATSLCYIMLALSGTTHALKKFTFDWGFLDSHPPILQSSELQVQLKDLLAESPRPVHALSAARIEGQAAVRCGLLDRDTPGATQYVWCSNGKSIESGDAHYANSLALSFANAPNAQATNSELVTKFRKGYGFIFKRLPVQIVSLDNSPYRSIAVDTEHAHLSKRTKVSDIMEALIFINLHKFHFVDPLSKEVRDWLTVIACLLIVLTGAFGISLLLRKRRN